MRLVTLIERKRDGGPLTPQEWRWVIAEYARDRLPDYQMASLLMAAFLNGVERDELAAMTDAMVQSGARLELASPGVPVIDKHSTGGVGDKVSLVLAPLVACCGVAVPMMSGRGLGHTGGTLDKLEAIPGFRTALSLAEVKRQVERLGCAMFGQTSEVAPADRRLYALRHATGTVEAIPFIAASIMSKKLAEGLTGLVLDVKQGSGAFLPETEDALDLARTMIGLGVDRDCPAVALVTAMDRPLGVACGNALETREAILSLTGQGPPDLMELTYALGAEMLVLGSVARDYGRARKVLEDAIASGRAAEKFARIIQAQGGDAAVIEQPDRLPRSPVVGEVRASQPGLVAGVEPRTIGRAIVAMGGGRWTVEDAVDPGVGFEILVKPGERVEQGQPLATIHARDATGLAAGRKALEGALTVRSRMTRPPLPLVSHRVSGKGVDVLA